MVDTADLVRLMRRMSGQPLRELARRAGTSAPALVDYEAGRHEPKLSTLLRLAEASGCELVVNVRPRLTPSEQRTLELHRLIAEKLALDPEAIRAQGVRNLAVMRAADSNGHTATYLDEWQRLIEGPLSALVETLISIDQRARDLRQSSPFAGVLSEDERMSVLRRAQTSGVPA